MSHTTCQQIQRQTHLLDILSSDMISHATSQEAQRQTHSLDVFQFT